MTKRHGAQRSRVAGWPLAALVLALAGQGSVLHPVWGPAHAQDSGTPAPTPSSGRPIDFRLPPADSGRPTGVQGPSDNGLPPLAPNERRGVPTPAPTPAPQPAPPRVTPTQPTPSTATPAPAPTRRVQPTPAPSPTRAAPNPAAPNVAPPASGDPGLAPVDSTAPPAAPVPQPVPADDAAPAPARASTSGSGDTPLWAWLLAGLAAVGAGVWYWRRRPAFAGADEAHEADEADQVDEAGAPVPEVPPPAQRTATPAPRPATPTITAPSASSPLVTRPMDEQRALVTMMLDVHAIRATAEQVAVSFTLDLGNRGTLAATGLMVRIALGQGSAMPEAVLARFFDGAGGSVLRDDIILAPGASERISTDVMLPRAAFDPLMIGGKPMLVPVLAFDVTYHWDGPGDAFGQVAGSFVLGRAPAAGGGDKLAPLPLDRLAYAIDRPGARATAIRRNQ